MDFEKARFNMIEQQIRPWNVLNQEVLDLLSVIKRERFVPEALQKLAFTDCELPIRINGKDTGEMMLAPKIQAKFLQEALVNRGQSVLEIGTGYGYLAALLAQHAQQVTTVEINPEIAENASFNLKKEGISRVKVVQGCAFEMAGRLGQFDTIVMSGSSPALPTALIQSCLSPKGLFIGIVGEEPVMQAVLARKTAEGNIVTTPLFETLTQPLKNAPELNHFVF